MRIRVLLAACVLLLPAPACADIRVMAYGDSITTGSDVFQPENSYPGELQRLRPDLQVVNEGLAGDVSENFERFRQAVTNDRPQVVVLLLGTNDPVCDAKLPSCAGADATPERTVANLFRMAEEARDAGADVIILTPLPAVCAGGCPSRPDVEFAMAMRQAFTGRVAEELLRTRPPAGVRVANLRGAFTNESWSALSTDGLHPSSEGETAIAKFVSARIPKRGVLRRSPPAAEAAPAPGAEPHPFLRRPPRTPSPQR